MICFHFFRRDLVFSDGIWKKEIYFCYIVIRCVAHGECQKNSVCKTEMISFCLQRWRRLLLLNLKCKQAKKTKWKFAATNLVDVRAAGAWTAQLMTQEKRIFFFLLLNYLTTNHDNDDNNKNNSSGSSTKPQQKQANIICVVQRVSRQALNELTDASNIKRQYSFTGAWKTHFKTACSSPFLFLSFSVPFSPKFVDATRKDEKTYERTRRVAAAKMLTRFKMRKIVQEKYAAR